MPSAKARSGVALLVDPETPSPGPMLRLAPIHLALRALLGFEVVAALAALAFGLYLASSEPGFMDLRPAGWGFAATGLLAGVLNIGVLLGAPKFLPVRTVLAFPAVLGAGSWAISDPQPVTGGLLCWCSLGFWLCFAEWRRTLGS